MSKIANNITELIGNTPAIQNPANPEILNFSVIDEIIQVKDEEAADVTRQLAKAEGLLLGISSGAAAFAATQVAKGRRTRKKILIRMLENTPLQVDLHLLTIDSHESKNTDEHHLGSFYKHLRKLKAGILMA